jgi:hypothetical protein
VKIVKLGGIDALIRISIIEDDPVRRSACTVFLSIAENELARVLLTKEIRKKIIDEALSPLEAGA